MGDSWPLGIDRGNSGGAALENGSVKTSIVIPTLNGGREFANCLDMISRQNTDAPFEVT